jgi:hypothetical protein
MPNTHNLVQRKLSLLQEAEIALYTVEAGLANLDKNMPYAPKPYYFVWYLLLSTGFERLMKIVICMHEFETTGSFPTNRFLRVTMGHNLIALRDEVVKRCYTTDYLSNSFAQEDYNFVTDDNLLTYILKTLSDFAERDRYMFMDRISNPVSEREWPKLRWEEIERIALSDSAYYRLLKDDYSELKKQANMITKAHIERFTRAITRLFMFGGLGDLARSQYALISKFMRLSDNDLGVNTYNL